MQIIIADKAGYCFGIENAMKMVEDTLANHQNQSIYTLGDISHNRQEMDRLIGRGVVKAETIDEIDHGCVIIRSHGVGKDVIEAAEAKGLEIVNATCPFVRAMQTKRATRLSLSAIGITRRSLALQAGAITKQLL